MISIVIITYNRCGLLLETVESILNQSYKNFELILVDDGSTDNTKRKIESLSDKRIKYFNFGKIGNLSRLRNLGIRNSNFEYIAFCDDDDLWFENKIEEQLKHISDFKMICSNAQVIDENDKVIKEKYYEYFTNDFVVSKEHLLRNGNSVLTSSLLIEKKVFFEKNIFFDEINVTNYCEDYELFLRLSRYYDFLFIDKNLIKKRSHSSISGGYENNLIMLNSSIKILENYTGNKNKNVDEFAVEGILGFKKLIFNISFKINTARGMKELLKYIAYVSNPSVFKVFYKSKFITKIKKTFKG